MNEFEELKKKYRDEMMKYTQNSAGNTSSAPITPEAALTPQATDMPQTPTPEGTPENPPASITQDIEKGFIQVRVSALRESVPVVGAKISITKPVGEEAAVMWSDTTDENGKSGVVELPAPKKSLSESPNQGGVPYAVYNVKIEAQGFYTVYNINVQVFSGELSIVAVDMIPKKETELFTEEDMTFTTPPGNLLNS